MFNVKPYLIRAKLERKIGWWLIDNGPCPCWFPAAKWRQRMARKGTFWYCLMWNDWRPLIYRKDWRTR